MRTTAPAINNKYYVSTKYGGFNRCIVINHANGSVLPNCTGYAYGRFMEIAEVDTCKLCTADAERWYAYNDGYSRGQTPKVGAVACWALGNPADGSDGHGHVAIVEEVSPDGTILVSQSGYYSKKFTTQYISPPYAINGLTFQGFIYNPVTDRNNIKAWGCDLSQHNSYDTDITKYDYVIFRATWGDHLDDKALYWRDMCEQLGVPYGVYCYSYSLSPEQAREEAQYLVNTIAGWNVTVGVWCDMEDADGYKAKNGVTTAEQWTAITNAFCEVVQANNYYTGVYANLNDFTHRIHIDKYDKWVACWGSNNGEVNYDSSALGTMLQYTSVGGLDRDACYVDLSHYSPLQPEYKPINEPAGELSEMAKDDGNKPVTAQNDYLFCISDKTYDALKFITNLLPLLCVFYSSVAPTLGLAETTTAVLTVASAIVVLLNSIADKSTVGYYRSKAE